MPDTWGVGSVAGGDGESVPSCPPGALRKKDFFVMMKATQDLDPNEGPDSVDDAVASFLSNFFPTSKRGNAHPSGRPFAPGTPNWPRLNDEIYKYYDYPVDDDGWEGTKIEDLHQLAGGIVGSTTRERLSAFLQSQLPRLSAASITCVGWGRLAVASGCRVTTLLAR